MSSFKAPPTTYNGLWDTLLDDPNFKSTFIQCMNHNITSPGSRKFLSQLPTIICQNDDSAFVRVIADIYLLPGRIKNTLEYSKGIYNFTFWRLVFTVATFVLILLGILAKLVIG